jgi:hypothetical protein
MSATCTTDDAFEKPIRTRLAVSSTGGRRRAHIQDGFERLGDREPRVNGTGVPLTPRRTQARDTFEGARGAGLRRERGSG